MSEQSKNPKDEDLKFVIVGNDVMIKSYKLNFYMIIPSTCDAVGIDICKKIYLALYQIWLSRKFCLGNAFDISEFNLATPAEKFDTRTVYFIRDQQGIRITVKHGDAIQYFDSLERFVEFCELVQ